MTMLLKFLHYNDILASSVAIGSNIVLLYLILTVNKMNIKKMNIILLPNCFIEIITAVITLITQPVGFTFWEEVFRNHGGILKWVPPF